MLTLQGASAKMSLLEKRFSSLKWRNMTWGWTNVCCSAGRSPMG